MRLEEQIRQTALDLGFCKCGITSVEPLERVLPEAVSRGGYDLWLKKFETGVDPKALYPDGESIIVLAYDYVRCDFPRELTEEIGRVYLSRVYLPLPGTEMEQRIRKFEDFLQRSGMNYVPDSNTLLLRPAAERAGVASFGRNNFSYVDGVGSFVTLYGFIVDRKLECDAPTSGCQCPPGCNACVKACPTKALYAPYKLDPYKCVGFSSWVRQEGRCHDIIPREMRPLLDRHIHGCDVCQEVCPRNRAVARAALPKDPLLEDIAEHFSLTELLHMPDGFYEKYVHPIMYNYIKDKKYFQRNAAVAIGNTGEKKYIPDLVQELTNPHEVVRIHVVWALGEMKDDTARDAIIRHRETEKSAAVLEEIDFVLGKA